MLTIGDWTVHVPYTLLPETADHGNSRPAVWLGDEFRDVTVGNLHRMFGDNFAKDFVSSAKLADILVRLDAPSLQALADGRTNRAPTLLVPMTTGSRSPTL